MNEIQVTNNNPLANIKNSKDVAGACKEIVTRSAVTISGKKYVPIEGWMSIATAHGCVLSSTDVKTVDGGISAKGIVRRISDGLILGEAEGFVGNDEKTWANRPMFAKRCMAQTRSMSRAARSVFAHVVVLMDTGLSTTPAEEMSDDISHPIKEVKEIKPEPVKQEIKPEQKQPVKSGINETFSKYKTAIHESLISMDIARFIKANQTFEKYINTLPAELFEEYEALINDSLSKICDALESGSINIDDSIESNLIKINGHWTNQIKQARLKYQQDAFTLKTKQEEEDYIF